MDKLTLARVIHILAVVVWIGGVSMVTMVIIPAIKKLNKKDKIQNFETIEGKFAFIAKIATLLTGISGFYMMYLLDAWDRYLDYRYWWIHAMTIVWLIFTIVLFILEPFVLHKLFKKYADKDDEKTFRIMHIAHWVLLILSFITLIGAVAGSHGWFIIK